MNRLIQLKRKIFSLIQRHFLIEKIHSIKNYLMTTEVTQGLALLSGKKVLVLAPHPDDESIGCGGTIRLLADQHSVVDVLYLTNGEKALATASPEMAKVRKREAEKACHLLGVRRIHYLNGSDGSLHLQPQLATQLLETLNVESYDVIFCPWFFDAHSDHAATHSILTRALIHYRRKTSIWMYEVWSPLMANHVVGIDAVLDIKKRAIDSHASQLSIIDYKQKCLGLAEHRSLLCPGSRFAEAFFVVDKEMLLTLPFVQAA